MDINTLFYWGMDRIIPNLLSPPRNGIVVHLGGNVKDQIPGRELIKYMNLPHYNAETDELPFEDGSVSCIHAYHVLEHIKNVPFLLSECQRVLKRHGVMNIVVPYYNSQMQAQDLDHKSAFCEDTWKTLFANPYYDKNEIDWRLQVGTNIIIGIKEANLCLMTQLIKV